MFHICLISFNIKFTKINKKQIYKISLYKQIFKNPQKSIERHNFSLKHPLENISSNMFNIGISHISSTTIHISCIKYMTPSGWLLKTKFQVFQGENLYFPGIIPGSRNLSAYHDDRQRNYWSIKYHFVRSKCGFIRLLQYYGRRFSETSARSRWSSKQILFDHMCFVRSYDRWSTL